MPIESNTTTEAEKGGESDEESEEKELAKCDSVYHFHMQCDLLVWIILMPTYY